MEQVGNDEAVNKLVSFEVVDRGVDRRTLKKKNKKGKEHTQSPSLKPTLNVDDIKKEQKGGTQSPSPSFQPTSLPSLSSQPSMCIDEPNWTVPNPNGGENGNASLLPFTGLSCSELETLVAGSDEGLVEDWCNFHQINTYTGKSAVQACCFCGGGDNVPVPCDDAPNWSHASGFDNIINCDFIADIGDTANLFCARIGTTKGTDGLTAMEACCACTDAEGKTGGFRPMFDSGSNSNGNGAIPSLTPMTTRRLQGQPPFAEDPSESTPRVDVRDWTTRTGLGESPGIPNLEYLGLGYDGLRGNPRGSISSEIDPGKSSIVFISHGSMVHI